MTTRLTILAAIRDVAAEQRKTVATLDDDLPLMETGLDSLCFAILVARLEDALGTDPFTTAGDGRLPSTVGELIAFYDNAIA